MEKNKIISHKEPPLFLKINKDYLNLATKKSEILTISLPPTIDADEYFLVIDIYSAKNHFHPEGHIGWWKYPLIKKKRDIKIKIWKSRKGIHVLSEDPKKPSAKWINPACLYRNDNILSVHVVLRNVETEAIEFEDIIYLYTDKISLQESLKQRQSLEKDLKLIKDVSTRWYCWPKNTHVHIVAIDIKERDAVGIFAISLFKLLKFNKVPCTLYAKNFDPVFRGTIKHISELISKVNESDVIFFNFSIFDPYLDLISTFACKKILFYHNITPPNMFQIYDAEHAAYCAEAFKQFDLVKRFDVYLTNSKASEAEFRNLLRDIQKESTEIENRDILEELRMALEKIKNNTNSTDINFEYESTESNLKEEKTDSKNLSILVCPPIINIRKWDYIDNEDIDLPDSKILLLYVGRIAPHKKIEDLIFLYNEYYKLNKDSSLLIVGNVTFKGYSNYIQYILDNKCPNIKENIFFITNVSDQQLKTIYTKSSLFITMSEHEGFCIPLVEAMYFKKPIFAFAQKAIEETMGNSGRLFYEKDFPTIASEIHYVLNNKNEYKKIISAQDKRFEELSIISDGKVLWEAFKRALFNASSF